MNQNMCFIMEASNIINEIFLKKKVQSHQASGSNQQVTTNKIEEHTKGHQQYDVNQKSLGNEKIYRTDNPVSSTNQQKERKEEKESIN